jgi:predicted DNA-binding protein with PD1-like motif
MRFRLLDPVYGRRRFAVVFEPGEEVSEGLLRLARSERLQGSHFTGIGALRDVALGFWDPEAKDYRRIPVREQVEVLSLVGNLARGPDGAPRLHAHLVVGKADGTAHGGHLLEAHVNPTLELIVSELPQQLQRQVDPLTGLPLLVP